MCGWATSHFKSCPVLIIVNSGGLLSSTHCVNALYSKLLITRTQELIPARRQISPRTRESFPPLHAYAACFPFVLALISCLIHKLIQFFFGYQLFDFVKSFYPVRVFDSLLSSEYAIHSLHPSFCLQSKRLFRITGLSKDCLLFYKLQFL